MSRPFEEAEVHRLFYANSHRLVSFVGATALGIGVSGRENIPQEDGAIIAANHRHWLDILTLPSAVPDRHVTMVARHDAFETPVMGRLFEWWGAVPVHRDEPSIEEMRRIVTIAKSGHLVAMFPERTRDKHRKKARHSADMKNFEPGIAQISRMARVPVVPTALYGMDSGLSWRRGIAFGEPMPYSENKKQDRDWIGELRIQIEQLYAYIDKKSFSEHLRTVFLPA